VYRQTMTLTAFFFNEDFVSTTARDLLELRQDDPTSAELRKIAANIIAAAVVDQNGGC